MLFDLEDYATSRIISSRGSSPLRTADQINWDDGPYTTFRATRDAYIQAIHQYYIVASVMSTPAERQQLDIDYLDLKDSLVDLDVKSRIFWPALISLPIKGDLQEGEKFNLQWVSIDDTTTGIDFWFPNEYYVPNWNNGVSGKYVAVSDVNGDYTYSTLTQAIYDDYKNALVTFQSKVKTLMLHGEGQSVFQEWVAPEVPAYALYPEITGYVRGTNSLSIKDAIVRIIDADGVAHEVITDDKGYYKFSNEYVYNNVALTAAGATNSFVDGSFNMFLLDHKNGSTASLYNKTSKFENSFFGAENNRSMTWSVYVKMGRNNRRNFKIEFIPNYSNFPSFSGYVKDAAGNPIKDALVYIKDPNSGAGIGLYRKPNGDDAINYKYNDFGVDRTILTDENGFYEYTSQMVGEWFNKHGFVEYGMPTTILTEPTRAYESMNRWMMSNEFIVYLMPYKQDANSTSFNWDGTLIYDNSDYVASRFEYALSNSAQQFYWRDIEMGQSNVFNVDVVPAVGDEVMADKIKMTCTPGSRNVGGYIETTTGNYKFVFSNGVSEVTSGWFDFSHSNYGYDTTMFSEEFYVYSCDSNGKASGYITKVDLNATEFSNISNIDFSETENLAKLDIPELYTSDIDLSGLSKLYKLRLSDSKYLETISGLEDSKYLSEVLITNNQRLTSLPFVNKDWIYSYEFTNLPMVSSLDLSTCGKKANNINLSVQLENLQSINLGFIGHSTDSFLTLYLNSCKQLLVDDVDLLLQQLVDSGKTGYLSTDKARSSDSDSAAEALSNKNWSLNFGSEYFESNEVKKSVVMYVDPSFGPDSNNSQKTISLNGNVTTTTGYFRLNAWYDNGYPLNQNIYQGQFNREINVEFDDTFESRSIEIYSTDQYGRPSGSITGIDFNNYNNEDFKNIVDIDLTQATELTSLIIKKSGLTSLDLTSNNLLQELHIYDSGKLTTIDVTGLTSLYNLELSNLGSLTTVDGFDTLSGLFYIKFKNCELEFLSLELFTSLHQVYLSNVFKYDSTHVDIMLQQLDASGSIPDQNGGCTFDVYMARTSDSDAAYDSLISKGWNIYLGSEFFPPYTPPVKGYITLDWDGNDQRYFYFNSLETTTLGGYYMVKDPSGNMVLSNNYFWTNKGVLEIWPVNSYGRPGGTITGIFVSNENVTSVDVSNHTSLTGLNLQNTKITTIDVSNHTSLIWLFLEYNSKITSIVGLNLLSKLQYLRLRECTKLTSVDTSGLESLKSLLLNNNSSLTDIDITTIGSKEITGLSVDNTFVSNSLSFASQNSHEHIVELPDGKFMVSGYSDTINRLNSDGTLDETFTTITLDSTTNGSKYINTMKVQADGKVLVGGEFDVIGGVTMSTIARINTDGTIDETFTTGNLLSGCAWDGTNFVGQKYMNTIKVQPDGKILIGGYFTVTSVNMYGLVRLNSDGTIDSTFVDGLSLPTGDINGFARLGGAYEDPRVIELQSDGKILVGGSQWNGWFLENGVDADGVQITKPIYRLNSDGTLDTTFDPNNNLSAAFWNNNNSVYVNSIAVDATGKILVGGWFDKFGSNSVGNLVRLNSDGTLDNSFTNILDELYKPISFGRINRNSLLFIGDKLFVGANGRSYILDENDNISEFIILNGASEWNQLTCAILTSNDDLVLTGNFNGSITMYPTEQGENSTFYGIVMFNYGTYNFKSLRELRIINQSFETTKHFDAHENITNIEYNYFRTFTSADLDILLSELDANGKSNGYLKTGYVARTEASDVAFNNLQSKGWSLNLGSYFIGPNETPAKGYIHFEDTTVNESISFNVNTETNYFVLKYPNGSTETRNGGWIYYDFNSDIPASERVFEIYGADQFGRPTDSITNITDLNECSSVEFSALKKLRFVGLDQNNRITTLNLDDVVSLESVFVNNCTLLETISIVGCTASKRDSYINSCPLLDIDAFLIQLDETGSLVHEAGATIYADQNYGSGFTPARTSTSSVAADSLISKGYILKVVEPAGDSIQIITHGTAPRESWYDPNDYGFGIQFMSSTGYAKIIFEAGSEFESQYPNGLFSGNGQKWSDYDSAAYGGFSSLFSASTLTSQKMTIFSCTEDGTPSGEIRYLKITGMARVFGSLSQLTKLRGLSLDMRWLKAQKTSVSLTGMKLEYLDIRHDGGVNGDEGNTYITNIDATPILPTLKAFHYHGTYNSAYPGTSVTGINFANLERMQIQGYDFGNTTLSGFTKINYLFLDSCFGLSIDFEGSITKNHAAMIADGVSEQYLIDNPVNKQLAYFRISGFDSNNVVNLSNLDSITLPQAIFMNNCNLSEPTNFVNTQSYSNVLIYNTTNITSISGKFYQFEINGCPQITSISINCNELRNIRINNCDSLQSCSIIVNGNYNGGLQQFDFIGCPQLTSVQLNAPYIYLGQLVLNNLPLLSSISISANYSDFYTLNVVNCQNLTQLPQTLFTNALYATVHNTPITVDISNNNRIYSLNLNQVSGVSGLSNKPTLSEVSIWDMNITSLNFSGSFGSDSGSNYSWKYLQLGNISGLTTLNLNNTNLRFLRIQGSTAQDSPSLRTSAMVDSIINALAAGSRYGGTFYFPSFPSYTTAASSAARTTLQNRSWVLQS